MGVCYQTACRQHGGWGGGGVKAQKWSPFYMKYNTGCELQMKENTVCVMQMKQNTICEMQMKQNTVCEMQVIIIDLYRTPRVQQAVLHKQL